MRLVDLENEVTAWSVYRLKKFKIPRTLIEEISDTPNDPPPVPKGKLSIHLRTPSDLNSIKVVSMRTKFCYWNVHIVEMFPLSLLQDNNMRNTSKISSFLKASSTSSATSNIVRTLQPVTSSIKPGPIFRTILAQGEVNSKYWELFTLFGRFSPLFINHLYGVL